MRPLVILFALLAATAAHSERYVIVNGQRLTDPQLIYLEQQACTPIPNGNYWLNTRTGAWGYAREPYVVRGRFGDACRNPVPRPSLSQRGMLFTPYDWVR